MMMKKTIFLLTIFVLALSGIGYAQEGKKDKETKIKNLIESKNYVFKAQSALPLGARTIQLTSDYDVQIARDTVTAYLPYYGRAYSAPVYPTEGGIQFTSADNEYTVQQDKHGGWDINIKPKETHDVQQLHLIISETGYATLQVTSLNRQAISFNGYVIERKSKKKK